MLFAELKRKGIVPGVTVKEINFFFDNCSGQNKNRMVLRFIVALVKMQLCQVARAVFLVRGHTKNDCDRLFNLMKKTYRKSNVYNEEDLMQAINKNEHVTAIRFHDFYDWDDFQNEAMRSIDSVLINHVFEATADDPNTLTTRKSVQETATSQELVKPEYKFIAWNETVLNLRKLQPPGIQDIKWRELYDKWRPLIPEDKRKGLKYLEEDPGQERRERVKAQTKTSKQQRQQRTRSAKSVTTKRSIESGII